MDDERTVALARGEADDLVKHAFGDVAITRRRSYVWPVVTGLVVGSAIGVGLARATRWAMEHVTVSVQP